jgi:predicted cupin superfamily sugar epimerase
VIHPDGTLETMKTGPSPENGDDFQIIIPANCWFAAEVEGVNNFTLVSCGVAPGFDFSDFELATRDRLCKEFPQHTALIQSFTRN